MTEDISFDEVRRELACIHPEVSTSDLDWATRAIVDFDGSNGSFTSFLLSESMKKNEHATRILRAELRRIQAER